MLIKDMLKMAKARPPQIKIDGEIWEDKNPNTIARTKKDMLKKRNRTFNRYTRTSELYQRSRSCIESLRK